MMRVAVVGGGQIARKVYLPTLAGMDDVELAVLVEPDGQRREAIACKYRFAAAVASVDELPEGQVDAAFERGIDVFSEKPMAADLAEAEEFAELAESSGRIFMVGFNRRFMPAYLKAKEFIGERPVWVCRGWKHAARLWAHSLHVLDMLRFFCGEPVRIQAEGNLDDAAKETAVGAVIRFDSGAIGLFETAGHYGRRQEELVAHGPVYTVEVLAPYEVVSAPTPTSGTPSPTACTASWTRSATSSTPSAPAPSPSTPRPRPSRATASPMTSWRWSGRGSPDPIRTAADRKGRKNSTK